MKRITRETEIKAITWEYVEVSDEQYAEWQKEGYSDGDIFDMVEEDEGAEFEASDDTERSEDYTVEEIPNE